MLSEGRLQDLHNPWPFRPGTLDSPDPVPTLENVESYAKALPDDLAS
jgi:hypothetical protein